MKNKMLSMLPVGTPVMFNKQAYSDYTYDEKNDCVYKICNTFQHKKQIGIITGLKKLISGKITEQTEDAEFLTHYCYGKRLTETTTTTFYEVAIGYTNKKIYVPLDNPVRINGTIELPYRYAGPHLCKNPKGGLPISCESVSKEMVQIENEQFIEKVEKEYFRQDV